MRHVWLSLVFVALVVGGLLLFMYLMQERLIFFTRPMSEARRAQIAAGRSFVDSVDITSADGGRLHAWHVRADSRTLILYFGGNAEDVSWMIDVARMRAPRLKWLLTDYRGYGSSAGEPSERALVADALAWFDFAAARLDAERIFVFGRSLGSGLAVRVAAERPVAGVITVAPFDSLRAVAAHYYPFLPVRALLEHPFDSLELAPRVTTPLLCFVATADEVVPIEHSRRLYDAWSGPKTWVQLEGAGHNSTDDAPLLWESIERFTGAP